MTNDMGIDALGTLWLYFVAFDLPPATLGAVPAVIFLVNFLDAGSLANLPAFSGARAFTADMTASTRRGGDALRLVSAIAWLWFQRMSHAVFQVGHRGVNVGAKI